MTSSPDPAGAPGEVHRFRHHPLLGTVLDVRVEHPEAERAALVDRIVVDEIARLERVLSIHDPTSELERWKRGEVATAGPDLRRALEEALAWQRRSNGAFNTSAGIVTALWRAAESRGVPPSIDDRRRAAARIAVPAYTVDPDGIPRRVGDASGIDLNAFAKGWIVDRAIEAAATVAPDADVVVSAGGDLRHHGSRSVRIGIEDPLRPFDNILPITTIRLRSAALATSGRARRGFAIGGRRFSHVIDPRTGDTLDQLASISIVAADAATADVTATIAGLMSPDEAAAVTAADGVACLVVPADGDPVANEPWRSLEA